MCIQKRLHPLLVRYHQNAQNYACVNLGSILSKKCKLFLFSIHVYSYFEHFYAMKVLNDTLFLYARICVTKNCPKFATSMEWHHFMNCRTTMLPNWKS